MPRDGLLRGEEIQPLDRTPRPQTAQEKRKNWWHYHWVHLVIAVVAVGILASILWSVFSQVKADYHVTVLTSYTFPEDGRRQMAKCLQQYADDRNGDGKVVVEVDAYSFATTEVSTPEQLQQQQSEMARFTVDTGENQSMIFFFDRAEFALMEDNFKGFFLYNDGAPMPKDADDFDNAQRSWNELAGLESFVPQTDVDAYFTGDQLDQLFEQLYVYRRSAVGYFEDQEVPMAYYRDSMALYDRVLAGEVS